MRKPSNKKTKVLFIDDSESDNDYIKLLVDIEKIEIDINFRGNGKEGFDYLQEVQADQFPDIIMVDINMPMVNGFEFLEIYQNEFFAKKPDTKIFMMSSTRRLSEIERAKNSVVVEEFFEKPLNKSHFENVILPVLTN